MTHSETLVDHDVGPEVSPYASTVCHLAFGGGRDLAIPRDLLRGTGKLNDLSNTAKGNQLRLEHISYEVGHILVHYLHTRAYQTLATGSTSTAELLDLSLQTYVTASNYGIEGLAELAKERVLQFATVVPAMSVLQATTKACQLLEGDDAWVLAFVTSQVRLLFKDPDTLDRKAFLNCFGTTKAANTVLVLAMIEYCTSKNEKETPQDPSIPAADVDEWVAPEEPVASAPEPEVEDPVPAPRPDPTDFHERESTMSPMPADSELDAEPFDETIYSPATASLELDAKAPESLTNGHATADLNGAGGESAQHESETKLGKKDKKKNKKKKKTKDDGPLNGVEPEARVLGGAPLNGHV